MSIDFDLSMFRLVKSFAAVEISRNTGASGPDDVAGQLPGDPILPRDADVSAPAVRPGLSFAAGNPAPSAVERIPEGLDDNMRVAAEQGLEGAEREATRWQYAQRNAALSLAGLARPAGSPDSRQSRNGASDQGAAQEADPVAAARTAMARSSAEAVPTQMDLAPVELAASEQAPARTPMAARSDGLIAATPAKQSVHSAATTAVPAAAQPVVAGLQKPQSLLASSVSLFGEAQVIDAMQSMVDDLPEDRHVTGSADRRPGGNQPILSAALDEAEAKNAVMRDSVRLSRPSVDDLAPGAQEAEVSDRGMGDEEPPAHRQGTANRSSVRTDMASRTLAATALKPDLPDALPHQLADRSQTISGEGAKQLDPSEPGPVSDEKPSELAGRTDMASRTLAASVPKSDLLDALPRQLAEGLGSQTISGEGAEWLDPSKPGPVSDEKPSELSGRTDMAASRTVAATVPKSDLLDALPRQLAEGHGSQTISGEGAEQFDPLEPGPVSDEKPSELAGTLPGVKAAAASAVPSVKVLDILDALVALSATAGEGSEDWQSFSSVILNAAMIPGWPPPKPVENPASVKKGDMMGQSPVSAEPEETPMTPEQLIAYLVSIGANLRLLRALQELVDRVEKKTGPALLGWLAGLVSALKVIEKSLKDIVEDGMELPEWLAELADAAKRPRRRKQFHI